MLTDDQIGGTARVVVGYVITYAVAKGWVTPTDAGALTTALLAAIVPVVHVAYILYTQTAAKKQTAALTTVAAIPRPDGQPTMIVTSRSVAAATPDLPNVIAANDVAVVNKVSGQELKAPAPIASKT